MDLESRIFVAGPDTLAGHALMDYLENAGYRNVFSIPSCDSESGSKDLLESFYADTQPDYVFVASGASGGIQENEDRPADLMLDNLYASICTIELAWRYRVRKLLYLASSCIYPKRAPQPLRLESLGTGPLEPTNEAYATAKLTGLRLCKAYQRQYNANFITAIPANPFGPHDDFSSQSGHVIPSLIAKMHTAKLHGEESVTIWGTGLPRRDFLFSEDLASACVKVLAEYQDTEPINISCQYDHSIAETAHIISKVVGYRGELRFDDSRPDGMPKKLLDASDLFRMGWRPTYDLRTAIEKTYAWYCEQSNHEVEHERAAV